MTVLEPPPPAAAHKSPTIIYCPIGCWVEDSEVDARKEKEKWAREMVQSAKCLLCKQARRFKPSLYHPLKNLTYACDSSTGGCGGDVETGWSLGLVGKPPWLN